MKIISVIGARPQFIKAATVSRALRSESGIQEILIHTGQHYDDKMSAVFFDELDIPRPGFNLEVGYGSHAYQTGMMLMGIENILIQEQPDWVIVYGDTNSTLAGALAASKLHIPVAHVEAGLRSFNKYMPEEINRIICDRIATLLFAPTETAVRNLANEGLSGLTRLTGDVMYDSVLYYKDKVLHATEKYQTRGIPENYFLLTVHRAENTDNIQNLENIFSALSEINFPVVLPIHPRTAKMISGNVIVSPNIIIIEPVSYLHMLKLTMDAVKVVTDSGGLQKEAYFLGKPCITVRNETEWIETLHDGWNILTGTTPGKIKQAIQTPIPTAEKGNKFGNGKAAELIVDNLKNR